MKAEFTEETPTSISEAATAVEAASASDVDEGSDPKWRPKEEFDPQVTLEVINSEGAVWRGKRWLVFSVLTVSRLDWIRARKVW